MDRVPASLISDLTAGQRAATRMILESTDRFTVVQGYAGVGKTTRIPGSHECHQSAAGRVTNPRVIGLAPTQHRAVGEMQSAGVDARTTASFLHDRSCCSTNGQTPDFSNTLFLLDESSMVGLRPDTQQKPTPSSSPAVDGRCPVGITTSCSPSRRASPFPG
ncbi:AAA family ATPase [Klebsiella pneumoniae]